MKAIHILVACLLLPSVAWAQAKGQDTGSSPAGSTDLASEVQALREALVQTQQQVAAQASEIQTLKAQSRAGAITAPSDNQVQVERAIDLSSPGFGAASTYNTGQASAHPPKQTGNEGKTPTGSFQFDNAVLEIGGFVDFETYSAPPTPRTTLQPHSDRYRLAIRRRDRSRNFGDGTILAV